MGYHLAWLTTISQYDSLQKRMRLGYARAARIVDMMEQEGIVGPADGSKPRELLVGQEILEVLAR